MKQIIQLIFLASFTGGTVFLGGCEGKLKDQKNNMEMKEQEHTYLFPQGEKLPEAWFVGNAYLQPLVSRDKNNNFVMGSVTFEPGARTNWHTHPKGQVLMVTEGLGWYQEKGKSAQPIKRGDVINIPENVEHWHGASEDNRMVHVAITNYEGEVNAVWLDPVSDKTYSEAKIYNEAK